MTVAIDVETRQVLAEHVKFGVLSSCVF